MVVSVANTFCVGRAGGEGRSERSVSEEKRRVGSLYHCFLADVIGGYPQDLPGNYRIYKGYKGYKGGRESRCMSIVWKRSGG